MKKIFFAGISIPFFILHGFQLSAPWNVIMFALTLAVVGAFVHLLDSFKFHPVRRIRIKWNQIQRLFHVLNRLSQLKASEFDDLVDPSAKVPSSNVVLSNQKFAVNSLLGEMDFLDLEKSVSPVKEVVYQSNHTFSDLQKIEEQIQNYSAEDKKLIIFATVASQAKETDLLDRLRSFQIPEFAVQREIFENTDVIEVSIGAFEKNKNVFYNLENIYKGVYKHFIFMTPFPNSKNTKNVLNSPSKDI